MTFYPSVSEMAGSISCRRAEIDKSRQILEKEMVGTNGSCMAGCIHVLYVHVPCVHYVPYLMHVYSMSFDAGQNPSVTYQVGRYTSLPSVSEGERTR